MTALALATILAGATAQIQQSFTLAAPVDQVTHWVLTHPNATAASMKCRIVGRKGNLTRLVKQTARGEFEFIVRETVTKDKTGVVRYTSVLVQSLRGGMTRSTIAATLTPYRGGTLVDLTAIAEVPDLPYGQVQIGLNTSARGFINMMGEVFGFRHGGET